MFDEKTDRTKLHVLKLLHQLKSYSQIRSVQEQRSLIPLLYCFQISSYNMIGIGSFISGTR